MSSSPTAPAPLAAALATALRDLGLSNSELARRLGCSRATVIELRQGKANPTLARVDRISAALGLHLDLTASSDPS